MKYKASFLGVPCYFEDFNNTVTARYGNINEVLLEIVTRIFCWVYKYSGNVQFPIKIIKE